MSDTALSLEESSSEEEPVVESLIAGRARRQTAGNRLLSLVTKEQDDDLGLLFAEDAEQEDDSFDEIDNDDGDADMDTSSSEDDETAEAAQELTGESELQRQVRQDTKKRKAQNKARQPGLQRKKVKTDTTVNGSTISTTATAPRVKKKSERASWVPSLLDGSTRVSSRKQTMQNREVVQKRLVDSAKQREKYMRQMEESQRRKEASKPKALTQAQRLAQAVEVETRNASNMSHWEEEEQRRIAERKAKLDALQSRQLTGPVVTWWSGLARWVGGKVVQLGVEEIRDKECKRKESIEEMSDVRSSAVEQPAESTEPDGLSSQFIARTSPAVPEADKLETQNQVDRELGRQELHDEHDSVMKEARTIKEDAPAEQALVFDGALGSTGPRGDADEHEASTDIAPIPATLTTNQHDVTKVPEARIKDTEDNAMFSSRSLYALRVYGAESSTLKSSLTKQHVSAQTGTAELWHLLLNEHPHGNKAHTQYRRGNTKANARGGKAGDEHHSANPAMCAITFHAASYREPTTLLPYSNRRAFDTIQRLLLPPLLGKDDSRPETKQGPRWSGALECFVGLDAQATSAAKGVPARFYQYQ